MSDLIVSCYDSFDSEFFEELPALLARDNFGIRLPSEIHRLEYRSETPFVTWVIRASILDEVFRLFVYCVVRKVHEQVVKVASERRHVILRREASETLLINKNSQWYHRRNKNIYAQIELQIIDKEGLVEITLSYVMFARLIPVKIASQKDALTLAARFRLYDKSFGLSVVELLFELLNVAW